MAKKKSRRPNLSQETLERARAEMRGDKEIADEAPEVVETASGAAPAAPVARKVKRPAGSLATRRIPSTTELISEYSYVTHDLRSVLILSGVLLALIVVAAVVLPRVVG